ncbi:MAG: hypothetical protein K2G25_00670 [Oscillospiraceae bacterium]|nr:hypothetical protein [Oscillospiraceae bacterium]
MKKTEILQDIIDRISPSGFLTRLIEKDMVYRLETVNDTRKMWGERYDIALYNRTNKNMGWLFGEIKKEAGFMFQYEDIIRNISSMKVAENPDYQYSAFYHLGILEKGNRIKALKFYFISRYENISDYHSKNFVYRDEEYLDFWGNCGLDNFSRLRSMAQDMRAYCGGHTWMAGIDISENGISKCKIYLKKMDNVYEYLKTAFNEIHHDKIEQLEIWNRRNPDFIMIGAAIGIDESGIPSLNLYFTTS